MTADAHYPGPLRPAPVSRAARLPTLAFLAALLIALSGCGSTPDRRTTAARPAAPPIRIVDVAPDDPVRANDVLMRALGLVGTPYRYGGNTPAGGFDCSGLVGFVYLDAARLYLPRTTREIAKVDSTTPPRDRLASGDIVVFADGGRVFHVGIYVGEGRFLHAPSTGKDVRVDSMASGYWSNKFMQARRVAM